MVIDGHSTPYTVIITLSLLQIFSFAQPVTHHLALPLAAIRLFLPPANTCSANAITEDPEGATGGRPDTREAKRCPDTSTPGLGSPCFDLEASDADAIRFPTGWGRGTATEVREPLGIRLGIEVLEGPGIRQVVVELVEGLSVVVVVVVGWELEGLSGRLLALVDVDGTRPTPRGRVVIEVGGREVGGLANILFGLIPSFFDRIPEEEDTPRVTGTAGNGLPLEAIGRVIDAFDGRVAGRRG